MADEMDDASWELLNGPDVDSAQGDTCRTLGMLVKMTRLHDLGLAQLCFDEAEVEFLTGEEERRDVDKDAYPQELDKDAPLELVKDAAPELDLGLALKGLALVDQS
jgi:hypothetical protein